MGAKLDEFRDELDDKTDRFLTDRDCHDRDVVEPEQIGKAFEDIETAIDGKPGDPGPLYRMSERVRRVVVALEARCRRG
jgi:hypothetical protein